jgi:amidohydrolase
MAVDFYQEALGLEEELVALRRELHRNPELSFQEFKTATLVAEKLSTLGLEVQSGIGQTGVVAMLDGERPGPTVMIRADIDALPIQEMNAVVYASQNPGVMHACGHDGHTAIALTVAKMLAGRRNQLAGRVKFVFQPAEEIGQGAQAMIADGVLENPAPDFVLGLHLWSDIPAGQLGVNPGPVMAAIDQWRCVVRGAGGHGAAPHLTRDPVTALLQIASALQAIKMREVDAFDPVVLSITMLRGSDNPSIIPEVAEMSGTLRTYHAETRHEVKERVEQIASDIARIMRCEAEIHWTGSSPAVVNDPMVAERVSDIAASVVGSENIVAQRTMLSEDVVFLMENIPGCYFFVGTKNIARGLDQSLHHPSFDIDETALPIGAAVLAGAAASYLISET